MLGPDQWRLPLAMALHAHVHAFGALRHTVRVKRLAATQNKHHVGLNLRADARCLRHDDAIGREYNGWLGVDDTATEKRVARHIEECGDIADPLEGQQERRDGVGTAIEIRTSKRSWSRRWRHILDCLHALLFVL